MTLPYILSITDFDSEIEKTESENFHIKEDYPRDMEMVYDEYMNGKTDPDGYEIVSSQEIEEVVPFIKSNKFWVSVNGELCVYNKKTKKYSKKFVDMEEYKMVTTKRK